ncbi:MAG: DUF58 domain-containing protein [Oscillospiraceae bacterium]|nr:DUF58 domain-containing protein [Oscillospiraceae bacterium]
MIMNYITKIKAHITIHSSKKTANILNGMYASIHKGRSMDFDDLRSYEIGDDVKDIDWKSSARSGHMLIRRYIADKKHNILLVLDTGKKMLADTRASESKKEVALMSAGILAYLANKNGDYIGAIYNKKDKVKYYPFKTGLYNIERIIANYEKDIEEESSPSIEETLEHVMKHIKKKTIMLIFTDVEGMDGLSESILRKVSMIHDVMIVNVNDAYMTGIEDNYDVDNSFYIPELIAKDTNLFELEKHIRDELYSKCEEKLKKYKISITTIDAVEEITVKLIDLLERHKYAHTN